MNKQDRAVLLRQLSEKYETADFLNGDPSWFMHQVKGKDNQEVMAFLASVLSFGKREITIVRECFGIGCHEKGLEEIGDQLGLTRERVRQIREKSIVKLRESGYAKLLIKYLG